MYFAYQGTRWFKAGSGELDQTLIKSLKDAINVGYRHFDAAESKGASFLTVSVYGTESELGVALTDSGLKRSDYFVTTKGKQGFPYRSIPKCQRSRKIAAVLSIKAQDGLC